MWEMWKPCKEIIDTNPPEKAKIVLFGMGIS